MKHKLFVYGTLKNGFTFHDKYLGDGKGVCLGRAYASPEYSLYVGAQPHLIKEKTDKAVKGELYEVDQDVLEDIDYLEAHPLIYRREIIEIYTETGEKLSVWAYLRNKNFKGKAQCFKEEEYI